MRQGRLRRPVGPVEQLALQVAGAVDGLQVASVEERDDLEEADLEL